MENKYTKGDIQNLQEYLLREHFNNEEMRKFLKRMYTLSTYDRKLMSPEKIKEHLKDRWIKDCTFNREYEALGESVHIKIYDILYIAKYEDVPLHMNDTNILPLVQWRLKIGK